MPNRRDFLSYVAGATAGLLVAKGTHANVGLPRRSSTQFGRAQAGVPAGKRRELSIGGRRIKTVDVHAHCFVPEVWDLVKNTPLADVAKVNISTPNLGLGNPQRLLDMDAQGIDYQAINVNAWGYSADRALATDLIALQNQTISRWCAARPDRFVGMATVALQHPDLAAQQLDEAVRKLGLRGAAIGGSVEGQELSDRKFDPFWAKAEELGVLLFMHPQAAPGTTTNPRLQGKGGLGNIIGNPLETTVFLSHLIFEGTLDRFPGLKICAAHAGGYLASYTGRSDAVCGRASGADCKALEKKPSEYFRRELLVDTMVFREDGLRHLIAEAGVGQMVYGTDYPYDWPVGIDFVLNAPFLSNADKEAILGGNALELLRIAA
ncbi:MAG TPA: amidohydrolase family protein [Vicinamibacterales bacterium]|nr:amidohydrolase family protein [Vicinamibacterales bacterium]